MATPIPGWPTTRFWPFVAEIVEVLMAYRQHSTRRGRVRATLEIDDTASQSVTSYAVSEPGV
jgi:hypothetical protein